MIDMIPLSLHRFNNTNSTGLLGYTTLPYEAVQDLEDDGAVILYSSVPGGATEKFNEGKVESLSSFETQTH